LWTLRAVDRVRDADLVLYDSLVDARALRRFAPGQCFCVGKRAGRASVSQETINRLMVRAARRGKHVVRLKGGDPFVFGRGGEEALALAMAGIPFEVVPGVTSAVAAPALAGIPVTHRALSSAFLVVSGHVSEGLDEVLHAVQPNSLSVVVLMGVRNREALAARMIARGWSPETPAAILCGASTPDAWTWTGPMCRMSEATPPEGLAGLLVLGEVVTVRDALAAAAATAGGNAGEVKYGRSR
jgi:uroporphyrin-III C-methyltransferase/precorrin-2 dehydrogenase/sirohydrochlorin ferrochelatase